MLDGMNFVPQLSTQIVLSFYLTANAYSIHLGMTTVTRATKTLASTPYKLEIVWVIPVDIIHDICSAQLLIILMSAHLVHVSSVGISRYNYFYRETPFDGTLNRLDSFLIHCISCSSKLVNRMLFTLSRIMVVTSAMCLDAMPQCIPNMLFVIEFLLTWERRSTCLERVLVTRLEAIHMTLKLSL